MLEVVVLGASASVVGIAAVRCFITPLSRVKTSHLSIYDIKRVE